MPLPLGRAGESAADTVALPPGRPESSAIDAPLGPFRRLTRSSSLAVRGLADVSLAF
jgi:hypothetical protein